MPPKTQDNARIVSVRLPDELIQRLDRYLDWSATSRRITSTRNATIREALSTWLDGQEQLAGLLEPHTLRRQFQAAYTSLRPHHDGVSIPRLRQLLRWPRERFDALLEELRADQHVDLDVIKESEMGAPAIEDSYHVHGQLYVRLRWRD
jgi:predicted DNA-binding protein